MKWVEIITLRSPSIINGQFIDELLKGVDESDGAADRPQRLVEIKICHRSVVETDLSIHLYWKSEPGSQNKSPLGLRFSCALKPLGLLNHSVWIETAALECLREPLTRVYTETATALTALAEAMQAQDAALSIDLDETTGEIEKFESSYMHPGRDADGAYQETLTLYRERAVAVSMVLQSASTKTEAEFTSPLLSIPNPM